MGTKGPLKILPRPFADNVMVLEFEGRSIKIDVESIGPFGGPRPLAKQNPEPTDEEIRQCMNSTAASNFAQGMAEEARFVVEAKLGKSIQQASREEVEDVLLELKQDWCEGVLTATSDKAEDPFPAEVLPPEPEPAPEGAPALPEGVNLEQ